MNPVCKRFRVVCPDCGAGGANEYPCFCHVCDDRVLMLPATQNWNEISRLYKGRVSTFSPSLESCNEQRRLRMPLWSDGKTSEEIQKLSEVDGNSVAYNLHEDLLCVKEDLAKANERVKELEKELKESEDDLDAAEQQLSSYENALEEVQAVFVDSDACPLFEPFNPRNLSAWLNKFAIEKKIEGIESSIAYAEGKAHFVDVSDLQDYIEQLRKEQE